LILRLINIQGSGQPPKIIPTIHAAGEIILSVLSGLNHTDNRIREICIMTKSFVVMAELAYVPFMKFRLWLIAHMVCM